MISITEIIIDRLIYEQAAMIQEKPMEYMKHVDAELISRFKNNPDVQRHFNVKNEIEMVASLMTEKSFTAASNFRIAIAEKIVTDDLRKKHVRAYLDNINNHFKQVSKLKADLQTLEGKHNTEIPRLNGNIMHINEELERQRHDEKKINTMLEKAISSALGKKFSFCDNCGEFKEVMIEENPFSYCSEHCQQAHQPF